MRAGVLPPWRLGALGLGLLATAVTAGCGGGNAGTASSGARPTTYGRGALVSEATRQIDVKLTDALRIEPSEITAKKGETVTLRVTNVGKIAHELTIGGRNAQEFHEAQMLADPASMPGMSAQDHQKMVKSAGGKIPSKKELAALNKKAEAFAAVHVMPGETKELTWTFNGEEPLVGCHIPGHYQGGMRGKVVLTS